MTTHITLDAFNLQQSAVHERLEEAQRPFRPNGIECPTCKHELVDMEQAPAPKPWATVRVHCLQCLFSGTRLL